MQASLFFKKWKSRSVFKKNQKPKKNWQLWRRWLYVLIMCKSKKRDENIQKPEENGKRYTAQGSLGIKYGQEDFFFLFFSLSLQVFFFFSFWLCKQYLLIVKNLENREMLENTEVNT